MKKIDRALDVLSKTNYAEHLILATGARAELNELKKIIAKVIKQHNRNYNVSVYTYIDEVGDEIEKLNGLLAKAIGEGTE